MKYLNVLLMSIIMLNSCGKDDSEAEYRDCSEVEYNTNFDVKLSDKVCFPNGNSLTVTKITHQFCPCEVHCDLVGGLQIELLVLTSTTTKKQEVLTYFLERDGNIFNNYEISSLSYKYGSDDEEIPRCEEDFDPEKTVLTFRISKL